MLRWADLTDASDVNFVNPSMAYVSVRVEAWFKVACLLPAALFAAVYVEAIAATALSTLYLHESLSLSRIAAVLLVVVGVAWLRRT